MFFVQKCLASLSFLCKMWMCFHCFSLVAPPDLARWKRGGFITCLNMTTSMCWDDGIVSKWFLLSVLFVEYWSIPGWFCLHTSHVQCILQSKLKCRTPFPLKRWCHSFVIVLVFMCLVGWQYFIRHPGVVVMSNYVFSCILDCIGKSTVSWQYSLLVQGQGNHCTRQIWKGPFCCASTSL